MIDTKITINRLVFILWLTASSCVWWACEKDYTPFDTQSTFIIGTPKIRFVNLHFRKARLNISIGGKLVQENLVHRQLTAYTEANAALLADSIITVTDSTGQLLLQDTLSIRQGNNYTLAVFPAYERAVTRWRASGNPPGDNRYLIKILTDRVNIALILDPLSSPFADRASIRLASLAPDHIGRNSIIGLVRAQSNQFADYFKEYQTTDVLPVLPIRGIDVKAPPGSYVSPYSVTTPGSFIARFGDALGEVSVVRPTCGTAETGCPFREFVFNPYNLEAGKSYTLLTNGTAGLVNDVTTIDIAKGVPLDPIPFEAFLLDDADVSSRTLVPMPLSRATRNLAILPFFNLNYQWQIANPNAQLRLSIRGVPLLAEYTDLNPTMLELTPDIWSMAQTSQFGNQTIQVSINGTARPVLAATEATLNPNGKYLSFYYVDTDNTSKFKILPADTMFRYGYVRVNFAHFSPNLGPVDIVDESDRVLLSNVTFGNMSQSVELPISRTNTSGFYEERVEKLHVVRAGSGDFLFDVTLSKSNPIINDTPTQLLAGGGRENSALMYTIIFSGRYKTTNTSQAFEQRLFGMERAENPKTSADDSFDLRLYYGRIR